LTINTINFSEINFSRPTISVVYIHRFLLNCWLQEK